MNARLGTGALDMPAYPCYETDKGRTALHAILPQNQLLSILVNHDIFRVFKVFYGQVFLGGLFRVWF